MREIKFRAWLTGDGDTETPRMIQPCEVEFIKFGKFDDDSTLRFGVRVLDESSFVTAVNLDGRVEAIVEQFTGLQDANGVDIYEGDIVRYVRDWDVEFEVVEFEGGGFSPFAIPGWECSVDSGKAEVVGNITTARHR